MKNLIEFIRAIIRPILVIAFATIFLWAVVIVVLKFLNNEMANLLFRAFIDAVILIIGIWIGGRIKK